MKRQDKLRFCQQKYTISRLLLWWLDFFPCRQKPLPDKKELKKILVIQSHLIGDLVMTTPVFRGLKEHYPKAKIYLLANPIAGDILKYDSSIDELILAKFPWSTYDYSLKNLFDFIWTIIKLRREQIDLAIDLRGDIRNIIIMWIMAATSRLSFGSTGGKSLLTNTVPINNERHLIEYNWSILNYLGCYDEKQKMPILIHSSDEADIINNYLNAKGIDKSRYVVINPGASYSTKRWSYGKFIELKKAIEKKYGVFVIWSFPPGTIPQEFNGEKNIFTSCLNCLFALLEHAQFYIGLDSGVGHIAAAFDRPSVILFGPIDPELSKPLNDKLEIVMARHLNCRPCGLKKCAKETTCMDMITVENVMTIVDKLIVRTTPGLKQE